MVDIKISKGLDIPIEGDPSGSVKSLLPSNLVALDLKPFDNIKFRLLVKAGESVLTGQPLAEDKETPGRMFVSPATGVVKEVRRGLKRSLQDIVIELSQQESFFVLPRFNVVSATRQELLTFLLNSGAFTAIHSRPFSLLANPTKPPRCIFVKAIESAPFTPSAEIQITGLEDEIYAGLQTLTKLTDGKVHLIYRKGSSFKAFTDASNIIKHTAEGPHPIANASLHIQKIDPIRSADDIIWTISAYDVASIGSLLIKGHALTNRVISIAGPGILTDRIGFFKVRNGTSINSLVSGRLPKGNIRLISGDPLMGKKVSADDFLGFYDTVFCAIPENTQREFLHFMGLGYRKYSFSKAYLSGHLNNKDKKFSFTTNQHGEHRPFIDSTLYDKVMPLKIPTMLLVKAVMAEDYELADSLGLLEVDSEDFALPAFVCPSKMEMTDIIKIGIRQYAKEVLA
jgi:Na+-transporting NADH:ubiquinone oxidoreductase subunit A